MLQLVICNQLTSPQLQNWSLPPPPPADGRILPQDMKGGHQWLLQHLREDLYGPSKQKVSIK